MFKSQVQILQSALSAQQKPAITDGDFVIFRVEDLPCRPSTAIKAIGYKAERAGAIYSVEKQQRNKSLFPSYL